MACTLIPKALRLLTQVMAGVRHAIGKDMNDWGIPDWLEREVRERDKTCVYCGIQMIERMSPRGPRKAVTNQRGKHHDGTT